MNIGNFVENARYSEILEKLVDNLGGVCILRCEYEAGYQGYVDIDVMLKNRQVFSYKYSYGSCSVCDEWESRHLSEDAILDEMQKGCYIFNSYVSYLIWRIKQT